MFFFNQALEAIDEVGDILQLKYSKQTQKIKNKILVWYSYFSFKS